MFMYKFKIVKDFLSYCHSFAFVGINIITFIGLKYLGTSYSDARARLFFSDLL